MRNIQPVVGRWQFFFSICKDARTLENGWFVLGCGIIKITKLPKLGDILGKENYKGIWIRFAFWIPFDHA